MIMLSILAAREQVNPVDLLREVIEMEQNGIEKCWTSTTCLGDKVELQAVLLCLGWARLGLGWCSSGKN